MDRDHRFPKTWKEARRKRAFELKQQGWKQRDIAEAFAVSPAAVSQWVAKVRKHGMEAWRAKPRPTGPIKLTDAQLRLIPELLSHSAEAYGFRGAVWTCARVAAVIREEFGVSYHKAHVSRLLKRLRWTPQMPIERAVQRDEAVIKQWRIHVWPELKKRHVSKAGPLFLWMSRAFISCQGGSEHMHHADTHQCCGGHIAVLMYRS
jgi:transposase